MLWKWNNVKEALHSCTGKRYKTASVRDIKTYTGGAYSFLNSAPDTGQWSPERQGRCTPQGKTPRTHWIRGWVNPRAGWTAEPCRNMNSDRPASRLVTIPTTPCRIGFQVTQIEAQINRKLVYFEPIRAETRLRYQASPRGTCDGQSAIEISLPPITSTLPCQHHSIRAPYYRCYTILPADTVIK